LKKKQDDVAHELRTPKVPPVRGSVSGSESGLPAGNTPRD